MMSSHFHPVFEVIGGCSVHQVIEHRVDAGDAESFVPCGIASLAAIFEKLERLARGEANGCSCSATTTAFSKMSRTRRSCSGVTSTGVEGTRSISAASL